MGISSADLLEKVDQKFPVQFHFLLKTAEEFCQDILYPKAADFKVEFYLAKTETESLVSDKYALKQ